MLRKMGLLLILASLCVSLLFTVGCAPKGTKTETMTELEEARAACESARATAKDLELRRMDLEEEKEAKEAELAKLIAERDALKKKKVK